MNTHMHTCAHTLLWWCSKILLKTRSWIPTPFI